MGINVKMTGWEVDLYGEIIDADDLFVELFSPYYSDINSHFLRYIGPNTFTLFNNSQVADFIPELKDAIRNAERPEVVEIGKKLLLLSLNYMKEGNTNLEFIGD